MTIADLEALLDRQGETCGICCTSKRAGNGDWVVDHHHSMRETFLSAIGVATRHPDDARARADEVVRAYRRSVRGVLCGPCNKGLGHAREDKARLLALAAAMEA